VPWVLGDRGLLIHLFGGIGGPPAEPIAFFTVTGHFAFGEAEVVRDPFTGELQFALRYHQIYANNPDGIVAGTQDWSAYAGDLRRGWLGTRPFSDLLVKLDRFDEPARSDFGAGESQLSLLRELQLQAEVLMPATAAAMAPASTAWARRSPAYRTPARPWRLRWERLRLRLASATSQGPGSGPDAERIQSLERLTRSLDGLLTPFGQMRADWPPQCGRGGTVVPGDGRGCGLPPQHRSAGHVC